MEEKTSSIESLFERVLAYANTNAVLLKLKAIDKSSDLISTLVPRMFVVMLIFMFMLVLNIGTALWIGGVLGKTYSGFFIVAVFYLIAAILVFFMRKQIKKRVGNSIITQVLN